MKSPWKYLVQLASLGRTVKEPEGSLKIEPAKPGGDDDDPIVEVSSVVIGNLDAETTDTVVVVVDEEEGAPRADDRASVPEQERPTQPLPAKRQRRSSKTTASAVAVTDAGEYGGSGSSVAPPPMTFLDEMAGLDEDIRQLRRQLAEKLLLQNTQLKKMLERYDVS